MSVAAVFRGDAVVVGVGEDGREVWQYEPAFAPEGNVIGPRYVGIVQGWLSSGEPLGFTSLVRVCQDLMAQIYIQENGTPVAGRGWEVRTNRLTTIVAFFRERQAVMAQRYSHEGALVNAATSLVLFHLACLIPIGTANAPVNRVENTITPDWRVEQVTSFVNITSIFVALTSNLNKDVSFYSTIVTELLSIRIGYWPEGIHRMHILFNGMLQLAILQIDNIVQTQGYQVAQETVEDMIGQFEQQEQFQSWAGCEVVQQSIVAELTAVGEELEGMSQDNARIYLNRLILEGSIGNSDDNRVDFSGARTSIQKMLFLMAYFNAGVNSAEETQRMQDVFEHPAIHKLP